MAIIPDQNTTRVAIIPSHVASILVDRNIPQDVKNRAMAQFIISQEELRKGQYDIFITEKIRLEADLKKAHENLQKIASDAKADKGVIKELTARIDHLNKEIADKTEDNKKKCDEFRSRISAIESENIRLTNGFNIKLKAIEDDNALKLKAANDRVQKAVEDAAALNAQLKSIQRKAQQETRDQEIKCIRSNLAEEKSRYERIANNSKKAALLTSFLIIPAISFYNKRNEALYEAQRIDLQIQYFEKHIEKMSPAEALNQAKKDTQFDLDYVERQAQEEIERYRDEYS